MPTTTAPQGFWADLFAHPVGDLLDAHDAPAALADLKPIVLVLLSAYWCPPCRAFTPALVQFLEAHADDVSVVYFSRDYNATQQAVNLRTKPYHKFAWHSHNVETFKALKTVYPSIRGIPTLFAVDRDSGKVLSEQARVAILATPETVLDDWRRGDDLSQAQVDEYWASQTQSDDKKTPDILAHLPLDTIVDAAGAPIAFDALHRFVVVYFGAVWAHAAEDKVTPALAAFASENAADVSVVYFSLDVDAADVDVALAGTGFARFQYSANLAQAAYALEKVLTAVDPRDTLAAPRVFVVDRQAGTVVASHHYGILIKPAALVPAWLKGEPGISDDEINAWFEAKWQESQKKAAEEEAAKQAEAAKPADA